MVEATPDARAGEVLGDDAPTPAATKVALLATLALTASALGLFVARAGDLVDARFAGWFLALFWILFVLRVSGQLLVRRRAPHWLPPTEQWNLMPYRLLLPIQLAMVGLMAWMTADFLREDGVFVRPAPGFGKFVIAFSLVYAGAMCVRYAVRMTRRPEARWFGGTIPIVFHLVLAAFLFVFGSFHASR